MGCSSLSAAAVPKAFFCLFCYADARSRCTETIYVPRHTNKKGARLGHTLSVSVPVPHYGRASHWSAPRFPYARRGLFASCVLFSF
jgi:hypothetical protein